MEKVISLYVHESQTPERLKNKDPKYEQINYKQLKDMGTLFAHMLFMVRLTQTKKENEDLGGFAVGSINKLLIDGYGTQVDEVKIGIQERIDRYYNDVSFPIGDLKSIGDLFFLGIDYEKHIIHDGLLRTMGLFV